VLLPVYVGNFTYSKKTYNFFVNGISGKVAGKTPISLLRVLFAVLMGIFALALVVVLLQNS
jgi:small-conductance mechanosensitive channel